MERLLLQFRTLGDEIIRIAKHDVTCAERRDADRHVDQEAPAPIVSVRYPTAQGRADHRRNQHGKAEQRHCHALPFPREGVEQYPLTAGLQTAAGESLDDTEQDQLTQTAGQSAHEGTEGEYCYRRQEVVAATEMGAQPAGDRQDEGVGGKVAGDDPLGVIGGSRQSPRDVAQRNQHDGGVEHLHERRHNDYRGDQPRAPRNLGSRGRKRRGCHFFAPGGFAVGSGAEVCRNFPASGPVGGSLKRT